MSTREQVWDVIASALADSNMWIDDDGQPLDYLPEREARMTDFVQEATDALEPLLTATEATVARCAALAAELETERPSSSAWRGAYRNNARRLRDALAGGGE